MKIKIETLFRLLVCAFLVGIAFSVEVKADEWNGSGTVGTSCRGQANCECNQGANQLCLWDQTSHVMLKVSLYYFPTNNGFNGGRQIGYKIYGKGNYSRYASFFSGQTIIQLPNSFPSSTKASDISTPSKAYFYENRTNFVQLFNSITGANIQSDANISAWMLNYCRNNGYGNTLSSCHTNTGGTKGFRIVIEPIVTGLYGSNDVIKIGTIKSIFGGYNIWNSSETKKQASTYMYLNFSDVGFSRGDSAGTTVLSTVASKTSGYGLNMFTWPININPDPSSDGAVAEACNPSTEGVRTCCSRYNIENASDPSNYDSSKIKTPMTQEQLDEAGCRAPIACPYELAVTIPTTCQNSTAGSVSDSASWECVFNSTMPDKDSSVKNNYFVSGFSNKYCAVYCTEKIQYQMPSAGAYAKTGAYFTVDTTSGLNKIGPISYTGTSTCRTTSQKNSSDGNINLTRFVADFNAANREVLVAYDNWQYAELQNEIINGATSHSWSTTCRGTNRCSARRSGTYYTYSNRTFNGSTFSKSTDISNGSCSCSNNCGSSCNARASLKDTATLKNIYQNAIAKRTGILEELYKCNNFYKTYNNFKPQVKLIYDDPVYKGEYVLKSTASASSTTDYFNSGNSKGEKNYSIISYPNSINLDPSSESSAYITNPTAQRGYIGYISYNNCGYGVTKQGCTAVSTYAYQTNTWFEQTTERSYKFTLPDGLYNYIDKPSGFSTSTPTSNYKYMPFSNLPVHYSSPVGTHVYYIETSSYGSGNKFDQYTINNARFNGGFYQADNKYSCTYNLNTEDTLICIEGSRDPACTKIGGLSVIVRPISLYYPFPGLNASQNNQRTPGKNWSADSGTDKVNQYIYNNRGASYYDLYKLDPMYEVDLTPALMREIQQYNRAQNNKKQWYYEGTSKSVYNAVGYSDFTLNCSTSAGGKDSNCTSAIIRDWGVKGCAIAGSGYTKCGTTSAW